MDVAPTLSPVSILYVITKGTWGGAQRYVYELAVEAHKRGVVVSVATGTRGELTERLETDGIAVVVIPGLSRDIRLGSDIRAFLGLVSLIRREKPATVHTNSSKAGVIAALAARVVGVRQIVFTAHGWAWNELRPLWQQRAFKFLHFMSVFASHTVIAVSDAVARDAAWMPFSKRKIVTIRLGVSPLPLLPRSESRREIESILRVSVPTQAFWIGAIAELHPTKGLDVLIRAFAPLAETFPETVLVLIGAGQDRGRLTALTHMLHIESRVFFAGHIRDAARLLPALDMFVLPSHSEALGYVLLEAGQANLPVVASNVGGIPEIIIDEETGYLSEPGNPSALTAKLSTLIKDAETRAQFAEALHELVLTEFSRERMFDETFSLYSLSS